MLQTDQPDDRNKKKGSGSVIKLLIWCMPTLILLLISIFWTDIIPDRGSYLSYVMIAMLGLIITRIIFLLRSQRKTDSKVVLLSVWVVIFLVIFFVAHFITILMPKTIHQVIKTDAQSRFEADFSYLFSESGFAPLEVGNAESIEYHTVDWHAMILDSSTGILLCCYSEEEYERAIVSLEERFRFRTEPLGTGCYDDDHVEITCDPYATIGNERFMMLDPGDGDSSAFYKCCFLIMMNDSEHQIAYIGFYDVDLDRAESLEELITDWCNLEYLHL